MALRDLPIRTKGLLLVAVPLVFQVLIFSGLWFLLYEAERQAQMEARSRSIVECIATVRTMMTDGVTALGLFYWTKDPSKKDRYRDLAQSVQESMKRLKKLCADRPAQLKAVAKLEQSTNQSIELLDGLQSSITEGGGHLSAMSMHQVNAEAKKCMKILNSDFAEFDKQERERVKSRSRSQEYFRSLLRIGVIIEVLANVVLALLIASAFSKGIVGRLMVLTENSLRLAKGEPLIPELGGKDELARLDSTFHNMAAELNAATAGLKEREEKLRSIYDNVPVGLLVVKSDGNVESFNANAETIVGKSVDGANIESLLPPEAREALAPGKTLARPVQISKNDDTKFVDVKEVPFQSVGEARNLVMLVDVSEREKLAEMRRQFVAMISHDIRSPLTALCLLFESFIKGHYGPQEEAGLKKLRGSYSAVSHIVDLVSDLLDLEKAEEGMMELSLELLPLQAILDSALDAIDSMSASKNVELVCPGTEEYLRVDSKKLLRVLVNLLSNAIKFSPENSKVNIAVKEIEDGKQVELSVSDEGPGISAEEMPMLFQRYKQTSAGKEKGGSGLGLVISKMIVEAHGGSIGVESEVGKGSRFWVRLPAPEKCEL